MATGGGENTQVERVPTPPIPEGCQVLSHQVAGHMHGHGRSKAGMLQHLDGTILKPTQCPPKGQRELDFYTELFREDQDEPVMLSLQYYVPRFRGIFTTPSNPDTIYMKLDDATQKFHKPCIVDVKMGRRCYEDGAPVEKVELALKKYPPVEQVGFQILGMRIYHPSVDQYVFYDKTYGRSLDEDQVIEGLARFLNSDEDFRMDVIPTFIKKLEEIQNWFENQTKMHFFSSSLLLVYEGDVQISSDEENEFVQLNPNIVSFAELEMTNSDAKQSNSDKDYLSFPPPSLLHKDKAGEHVSMATAPNNVGDKVDDQKSLVNGLDGPKASLQEDATVEQSFTETLHIKESDDDDDEVIGALTVAEMRARQKKKLAPPSTVTPLASLSQDPDWSSRDTCDLKPPIAEAGLPMQACASEPINLVTSTIDDRLADVKMIDFTHVIPSNSVDENYLYGLRRLIQHFKTLNVCGFEY